MKNLRPSSSPKKFSNCPPVKQKTSTVHHQISHPTKSPKSPRKQITPHKDSIQRRVRTPPPATFQQTINVPDPLTRRTTNEAKRAVESHSRQEKQDRQERQEKCDRQENHRQQEKLELKADGTGYLFEKMFKASEESTSDHHDTPDEPSEYELYEESKDFDQQDTHDTIFASHGSSVLTPRKSLDSPAHSKYKQNQLNVQPLNNSGEYMHPV